MVVVAGRVSTTSDTGGCCEVADCVAPETPVVGDVVVVFGRCVVVLCPLLVVVD
jgi:hypothetical protein